MVRNYIKDNGLPCTGDGRGRRFVWADVREWFVKYRIELAGSRGNLGSQIPVVSEETLEEAILRRTKAEADLKELQLAKERGQVASIADVEKAIAASTIVAQTQILAVPSRLASRLLGMDDYKRVVAILEGEMRQLLSNLATIDAVFGAASAVTSSAASNFSAGIAASFCHCDDWSRVIPSSSRVLEEEGLEQTTVSMPDVSLSVVQNAHLFVEAAKCRTLRHYLAGPVHAVRRSPSSR